MKIHKMSRGAVLGSLLVAGALVVPAVAAPLSAPAPDPYPRIAFVARNDNPFDALGVGAIAGAVGGVIAITPPTSLSVPAATVLTEFDPDLVIIAGGVGAVSQQVEDDIEALGEWDVERAAGNTRDETAREVARIIDRHGLARPAMLSTSSGQNVGDLFLGGHFEAESATIGGVDIPQAAPLVPMAWTDRERDPVRTWDDEESQLFALDVDIPADGGVLVVDYNSTFESSNSTNSLSGSIFITLDYDDTGNEAAFIAATIGASSHEMSADTPDQADSTSTPTQGAVQIDAGEHTIYVTALIPADVSVSLPTISAVWYPSGTAADPGVIVPAS